jgi:hypothetical protein
VNRELRDTVLSDWAKTGGIDMSWLYGHQDHLPRVENVPAPRQELKL